MSSVAATENLTLTLILGTLILGTLILGTLILGWRQGAWT
jgi:hypothetical protein